jgi:hypothetical protein
MCQWAEGEYFSNVRTLVLLFLCDEFCCYPLCTKESIVPRSENRQDAIKALMAEGASGIRGNLPGLLTVSVSARQAISSVLPTGGARRCRSCGCREQRRHHQVQLLLCSLHRASVGRLFKAAGLAITPLKPRPTAGFATVAPRPASGLASKPNARTPDVRLKRRVRKRNGGTDVYKAGRVVSGGLPSLGKRR